MSDGRIALISIIAFAIWLYVVLPLIYLSSDFPNEIVRFAPVVTAASAICAVSIASFAFFVARRQLLLNRQHQRENTAKTSFREFLKLCVDLPEFANGNAVGNQVRYEWFVAHFLWAAEEILEFDPVTWEKNLQLYVRYHQHYLRDDKRFRTEDFLTYTPKLRNFIDSTLANLPIGDTAVAEQAMVPSVEQL
jgi:hypothetical protein